MAPGIVEKELVDLLKKNTDLLEKVNTDVVGLTDRIKAVESNVAPFKGVDVKAVVDGLAECKAGYEAINQTIRNRKTGVYVPGLEDEAGKFSLAKALVARSIGGRRASKKSFESIGAGHEFACLKAAQERLYTLEPTLRAQQVSDDELGGFFVPDQLIPDVIGAIYATSVLISQGEKGQTRVTVLDGLTGGEVTIPKFFGGMVSKWIGERQTGDETEAKVGVITLKQRKCGSFVVLTEDMIRNGGLGFDALIRKDLTESVAALIDTTAIYGRGTDYEPLGLMHDEEIKIYRCEDKKVFANIAAVEAEGSPNWQGGKFTFDTLTEMWLALKRDDVMPGPSAAMVTSPDIISRLKNLKISYFSNQSVDQAYLLGIPNISDARLRELIGDFGETTRIPYNNLPGESIGATTASTTEKFSDVVVGNMADMIVGRWGGIEIVSDDGKGTGFKNEETNLRVRQRMDMKVRQPRSFIFTPDAQALS